MTKTTFKALLISLLSMFAIACGNPGYDPEARDPGLEQNVGAEEGDVDGEEADEGEDFVDEENEDGVDEEEPDTFGDPICGDGVVHETELCDDGNESDGDGCTSTCLLEVDAQISIDITVDDLNSTAAPLSDTCSNAILLVWDGTSVVGEGSCTLDNNANFLDYVLDAEVDESGAATGEIEIILNRGSHFVEVEGTLDDGALSLQFFGVTLVTNSIRAIWNGDVTGIVE
jgi:cysteine-rich repeat protein